MGPLLGVGGYAAAQLKWNVSVGARDGVESGGSICPRALKANRQSRPATPPSALVLGLRRAWVVGAIMGGGGRGVATYASPFYSCSKSSRR